MTQRWKYKTEDVTVDGNTVKVRGLTYGERLKFGAASKAAREGQGDRQEIIGTLLTLGCVDITAEEIESMPAELLEAATDKILEMTGIKMGGDDPEIPAGAGQGPPGEKKAP